MAHLSVTSATQAQLPSLSTVVPRAFHKSNEYFRQALPDTSLVREWWSDLLRDAIQDPIYHVLTIIDDTAPSETRAVGLLLLRRIGLNGEGDNVFHRHPPTADHDHARYAAMLDGIEVARERFMSGRAHFSLDLFGVDEAYQGTGLGKKLLLGACRIADEAGADVFVQANMYARAFYEKQGFECVEEKILPGPEKYGEVYLIYRGQRGNATSPTQDD